MDSKSLDVFSAVSRSLSFTQAGADLHMSVSAVSRTISRLENELGVPLFDRDRRGMRPTAAALELAKSAQRIESEWRDLRRTLGSGSALTGELRIFCSVTATHRLLSPILSAYREACPGVEVLLITGDQADGLARVHRGEADVAVIGRPSQLPDAIAFLPVTRSPLRVCLPLADCPLRNSLAGAVSASAREQVLASSPWILPERGVTKDMIERWLLNRFGELPPVYARVAGHEAILAMVSLGLGIGAVPQLVIEASGLEGRLELEEDSDGLPPLAVGLAAREGRVQDPVVTELWRVTAEQEYA